MCARLFIVFVVGEKKEVRWIANIYGKHETTRFNALFSPTLYKSSGWANKSEEKKSLLSFRFSAFDLCCVDFSFFFFICLFRVRGSVYVFVPKSDEKNILVIAINYSQYRPTVYTFTTYIHSRYESNRQTGRVGRHTIYAIELKQAFNAFFSNLIYLLLTLDVSRKIVPVLFCIMAIIHRFRRYFVISSRKYMDIFFMFVCVHEIESNITKESLLKASTRTHSRVRTRGVPSVNRFYIFIDFSLSFLNPFSSWLQ